MSESRRSPALIIVCGLPGSGKTTHAVHLERSRGAVRLCPDEWMHSLDIDLYDERRRERIEALQWQLGQRLLSIGVPVIIEWGTWGLSERDALRLGARALGASVELHYMSAPVDVLFARIERRGMENPPITREALQGWARTFQEQSREEMALFDRCCTLTAEAE